MRGSAKPPVFLHRESYRQRRLRDAAKILPFVGMVLWAMPLLWSRAAKEDGVGAGGVIYIFGVWLVLIVSAALLAGRLRTDDDRPRDDAPQ